MKKDCVFFVINSLYGGGAEHVASRLSSLISKDYQLYIISLCELTSDDYPFAGEVISIADSYKGFLWVDKLRHAAKRIDELASLYSPKVMISFLQNANLCLMMTNYKARRIVSVRNNLDAQYSGMKRVMMTILVKHYFKKADCVVSVSKLLRDEMVTKFGIPENKSKFIYNPYDIDHIMKEANEPLDVITSEFYRSHFVISNVGHINAQKGQFHLVRLANHLRNKGYNIGVVIIGSEKGKTADNIRQLIKGYALEGHILLVGRQKNPYKFVYHSQLFVFPSLFEGFPNALVEAMICGKPVISADCKSGPREILIAGGENFGILLPNDTAQMLGSTIPLTENEQRFSKEIENLLNDDGLRSQLGEQAIIRASAFSEETIYKQWKKIIDSHVATV